MFGYLTEYEWINDLYFGNTVGSYLEALAIFIGLFLVFEIFQKIVLIYCARIFAKTKSLIDDFVVQTLRSIRPLFYWLVSLYFALHYLGLNQQLDVGLDIALMIIVVIQVVISTNKFVDLVTHSKTEKSKKNLTSVYALRVIVKVSVWVVGAVFLLSNLGVNVTSLIAGLGIGGIAVALAVQNVLEDLFSSFVIYFDKPFKIGDYITVGDHEGTVEKIGIKTTRLRALEGEEIVISNKELTSSRIQNYRLLKIRRVEIEVGVAYETPKKKLEKISSFVEEVISKVDKVQFEWAYIDRFDDSAITFVVVYNVLSDEYVEYMAANQEIHLGIIDKFNKQKIEIAYPTRVIYNRK